MTKRYKDMDRKRKQLLILEYPYKSDRQLFDYSGTEFDTRKVFDSVEDIMDFKEEMAQEDISLTNRRDFLVGEKPPKGSKTISFLDSLMKPFGDEQYRNALEMADCELDLKQAVKELMIIQYNRLLMGIEYEQDVGLGNNPETEACRAGLESILRTANDIIYGRKVDVHAEHHHALADEIMGIKIPEDEYLDIGGDIDDYDYSE